MGYGRANVGVRVQQELDQKMAPAGKVKQIMAREATALSQASSNPLLEYRGALNPVPRELCAKHVASYSKGMAYAPFIAVTTGDSSLLIEGAVSRMRSGITAELLRYARLRRAPSESTPEVCVPGLLNYSSAVVGSIIVVISQMRVAGKLLSFACARINSSSAAM
jgi:hypothetical protein